MTGKVPLFVELCAGSAAVSLGLIGGAGCRPPCSYMGAKTGLRAAVLHALGLRMGQGADALVLCDAGPWASVYGCLIDPAKCRAVADVIRGWIGEDARALWERLRAERVDEGTVLGAAGWLYLQEGSFCHKGPEAGIGNPEGKPPSPKQTGGIYYPAAVVLSRTLPSLSAVRFPPAAVIRGDAGAWGPREVARWLMLGKWSYRQGDPTSGGPVLPGDRREDTSAAAAAAAAAAMGDVPWPPTAIYRGDAGDVEPVPPLPEGTVMYLDPPYRNTSGYQHDLPRARVLEIARRWSDAGAIVCVSEAEPLDLPGWHHLEITGARVGQARTFSKQKREWLTMNREPVVRPQVQMGLFGEVA